ncbi:MAG: hypothetical protein JSS97_02390 [Actinobacteria bacterium]|nr:hypothetical protein [Actinomycetota bacterium]
MQRKPILDEADMDVAVLDRLCESGPWTPAELVRELNRDAIDAIGRLVEKGLAHRLDGREFVVASAAGRYAHQMDGEGA